MNMIQVLADYVVPAVIASMIIGGSVQIIRRSIADTRRTLKSQAVRVTHKNGRSVIVSRRMDRDDMKKLMELVR